MKNWKLWPTLKACSNSEIHCQRCTIAPHPNHNTDPFVAEQRELPGELQKNKQKKEAGRTGMARADSAIKMDQILNGIGTEQYPSEPSPNRHNMPLLG